MGKAAGSLHADSDKRLRALQLEMDRVSHNSNPVTKSCALHIAPQQYPTNTLRLELEKELDRLLREQVTAVIVASREISYLLHMVLRLLDILGA